MQFYWGALFALSVAYGTASLVLPRWLLKRRFATRKTEAFDALYRDHLSHLPYMKDLLRRLWVQSERTLGIESGKLRPTDRFAVELSCSCFPMSASTEDLWEELLVKGWKASKKERPEKNIETMLDYIEAAAWLETHPRSAAGTKERG